MASDYLISLALSVDDAGALWTAAAAVAMAAPGMTPDDVVETLGPREDPNIADCLALLIQPTRIPGCVVEPLECRIAGGAGAAVPAAAEVSAPIILSSSMPFRAERRIGLGGTQRSMLTAPPAPR